MSNHEETRGKKLQRVVLLNFEELTVVLAGLLYTA